MHLQIHTIENVFILVILLQANCDLFVLRFLKKMKNFAHDIIFYFIKMWFFRSFLSFVRHSITVILIIFFILYVVGS